MKIQDNNHLPPPEQLWKVYEENKIPELVALKKEEKIEKQLNYIGRQDAIRAQKYQRRKNLL